MAENETQQITERELREAELQMSGRPPSTATGFIGFVPAAPASANGGAPISGDVAPSASQAQQQSDKA